jgi:hypothetical protein
VEQNASGHEVEAAADEGGIVVSCTCGWRAWSRTSAVPVSLLAAERQLGGQHLAEVGAPVPPCGTSWAFGVLAVLVCVTILAVYLIWTW